MTQKDDNYHPPREKNIDSGRKIHLSRTKIYHLGESFFVPRGEYFLPDSGKLYPRQGEISPFVTHVVAGLSAPFPSVVV